ncbi:MAG: T9SS type A sorting domain-containing protein [Bacteroidota bacterium]
MHKIKWYIFVFAIFLNISTDAQFIDKTLTVEGNVRSYKVYLPINYDTNNELPLLFNFHGGGGNINDQIAISDMRSMADIAQFILVYPQAFPDPNDGGSTNWTHKDPATIDDIHFVSAMIDSIANEYSIDQSRVYACGYSNGGEFTFELACRLTDRIAAIGVVARSMFIETFNNCNPNHPTAVVTIHGTEDEYDGIIFGGFTWYVSLDDVNEYWSVYNQTSSEPVITNIMDSDPSDGSTVELQKWNNGEGCVSVEHYKVIGGGHDWPGSFGNNDIDSDLILWNFMSRYNMDGLITCNSTSSENLDIQYFQIYPNPTNNSIQIKREKIERVEYELYSNNGQFIRKGWIIDSEETLSLKALKAGVYILKIKNQLFKIFKI